jgi:MFS family permease
MMLSAVFGFGFAGNMTCLSLCVRQAVLPKRFGTALGAVMMIAWAGMAAGGYMGGLLFDLSGSYTASFGLAAVAGVMNLAVISTIVSAKPIPLLQNSNERAKEASGLDGGFGWDWTAKRTSIWTAQRGDR